MPWLTLQAQTLFTSVGLRSRARAFLKNEGSATQKSLLTFVEDYFASASPSSILSHPNAKVICTTKAPIYLQHSGHSMTIIGLERWNDGSASLLVFDPFFSPSDAMRKLAGVRKLDSKINPREMLKLYRRKMPYLMKYREFEIMMVEREEEARL